MPHSTSIITSDDLFREINGAFQKTYRDVIGRSTNLASCMRLGVPSSRRKEFFGYMESPPKLSRLDRGESVTEDAFKAISSRLNGLIREQLIELFPANNPERCIARQLGDHWILQAPAEIHLTDHLFHRRFQ